MESRNDALACVVTPNGADAELALSFLGEQGIRARSFPDLRTLADTLHEGAGCVVIVEEALVESEVPVLRAALERLPAWSDLPLIVVSRDVAAQSSIVASVFPISGNVTLLERPLNPHTLVSAVQVGLRAAARQREAGELIAEREQAVRLRDEFLAMLAHELRNPLAPMRNALYVMQRFKFDDPLFAKTREILDRQVTHVVRMVDDLMDVARLERGKVVLQKRRVDLNTIVASALETCLHSAQERGHQVSVHFETHALPVDADPVRVEQVVCNLVNNAAKFTTQPDEIRVETSVEDGSAVVAVRDRGIGFEPEAAEKLFAPFMQVNTSLERTSGGLGIGLTIVKRLAELHGGSVRAESEGPGQGASFVVRLPLSAAEPATAPRPEPAAAPTRCQSIVVIDDNPDVRETLRMLLTLWGHDVRLADDGPGGLESVLSGRPDVALIDIGLPGMNGYELARAIRKSKLNVRIKLIAITGYGQPADRDLALQAGFDAHVLKPIPPEELARLLADA